MATQSAFHIIDPQPCDAEVQVRRLVEKYRRKKWIAVSLDIAVMEAMLQDIDRLRDEVGRARRALSSVAGGR